MITRWYLLIALALLTYSFPSVCQLILRPTYTGSYLGMPRCSHVHLPTSTYTTATYIYVRLRTSTYTTATYIYVQLRTCYVHYCYVHARTATYCYVHVHTATYIYVHARTATYIYLRATYSCVRAIMCYLALLSIESATSYYVLLTTKYSQCCFRPTFY